MFEDEAGLSLESQHTGKTFKVFLEDGIASLKIEP
jgi:hypothetical protein